MKKDALILLGMGGPDSVESIEPFLNNLLSDREIIDFKIGSFLQKQLVKIISKKRAAKIAPEYLKMGMPNGASPQTFYNNQLLIEIPKLYQKKYDISLDCYLGMCYFKPYIEETLATVKNRSYRNIIFFPLYPQYSSTTTGAVFNRIKSYKAIENSNYEKLIVIKEWYDNKLYNNALELRIKQAAKKLNQKLADCYILFSAHSIPMSYVEKGDTYEKSLAEHINILVKSLNLQYYSISYQSKLGPISWLGPSTKDSLKKIKDDNVKNVIIVPISFISDHIETLIEIDEHLIGEYSNSGMNIVRTESLNDSKDFLESIIDIINS